jgi:nucleotide-binding universal stress UspA family protein
MDPHLGQIVVPLDGSELAATALGPARALAAATGTSLRLVTTRWDHDTESPRQYLEGLTAQIASEHWTRS